MKAVYMHCGGFGCSHEFVVALYGALKHTTCSIVIGTDEESYPAITKYAPNDPRINITLTPKFDHPIRNGSLFWRQRWVNMQHLGDKYDGFVAVDIDVLFRKNIDFILDRFHPDKTYLNALGTVFTAPHKHADKYLRLAQRANLPTKAPLYVCCNFMGLTREWLNLHIRTISETLHRTCSSDETILTSIVGVEDPMRINIIRDENRRKFLADWKHRDDMPEEYRDGYIIHYANGSCINSDEWKATHAEARMAKFLWSADDTFIAAHYDKKARRALGL